DRRTRRIEAARGGRALKACLAFACLPLATTAAAQDTIEPDRPDVTNGTHIVEIGLLQIEMGGQFVHSSGAQRGFGSPLTARVGLADWIEARIGSDGFITQTDGL